MTRHTLSKLQKGPLEGATNIMKALGSEGSRIPATPSKSGTAEETPDVESTQKTTSGTGKRKAKVRFNQSLGWNEETQTWWMHKRIGRNTFTRDTGERKYADAEVWVFNFIKAWENEEKAGPSSRLTVKKGLEIWGEEALEVDEGQKKPSPERIASVKKRYRLWVLPLIGQMIVSELTTNDLKRVVQHYVDTPGPGGFHSPEGVRNFKCDLNTPLRFLKKHKHIKELCDLPFVPQPKVKSPVIVPFEMFWELLDRFDQLVGYDIYPMTYIRVMAFGGTRTDNTRSLLKEQFNSELTVFNTGITKNGEAYDLPIPEEVRQYLCRIPDMDKPGLLLPSGQGEKRSGGWCIGKLKQAAQEVGMTQRIAWHRLRATYATMLIRAGADPFVLMEAMGWKTVEIARHYVHTNLKDVMNAQESAMRLINGHRVKKSGVEQMPLVHASSMPFPEKKRT